MLTREITWNWKMERIKTARRAIKHSRRTPLGLGEWSARAIDWSPQIDKLCKLNSCCLPQSVMINPTGNHRQIFRIGTVRYAEGLWRMRRHGPVIAHCTDSESPFLRRSSCCVTVTLKQMIEKPTLTRGLEHFNATCIPTRSDCIIIVI